MFFEKKCGANDFSESTASKEKIGARRGGQMGKSAPMWVDFYWGKTTVVNKREIPRNPLRGAKGRVKNMTHVGRFFCRITDHSGRQRLFLKNPHLEVIRAILLTVTVHRHFYGP